MDVTRGRRRGGEDLGETGGRVGAERELKLMGWYDKEMPLHRVRPSVLQPVMQLAGFAGGFLSQLPAEALGRPVTNDLSRRATRAVEEAFTEHINDQLREIHALAPQAPPPDAEEGDQVGGNDPRDVARLKARLLETRDAERSQDILWGFREDQDPVENEEGDVFKTFQKQVLNADSLFRGSVKFILDASRKL
ncbi:ubiquinone biosynthesis protein COQ7 [Chloropicon primus]|nr:ubiquinone biosynthesis protein COQ7 [Chloropicon primus]